MKKLGRLSRQCARIPGFLHIKDQYQHIFGTTTAIKARFPSTSRWEKGATELQFDIRACFEMEVSEMRLKEELKLDGGR